MNNFRNDYTAFETAKKAYNKIMSRKISFLKENIGLIQQHFKVSENNRKLKVELSREILRRGLDYESRFII